MKKILSVILIVMICFFAFPIKMGEAKSNEIVINDETDTVVGSLIGNFSFELEHDPFLASLVELQKFANVIDSADPTAMGTYLKTTPWYSDETTRLGDKTKVKNLNEALAHLDLYSNLWPKQKIQCIGLGVMIHAMDARFVNIGGANVHFAAELIPESIRDGELYSVSGNGMIIKVVKTMDEISVGDYGVRYDSTTGHAFAVVGKKVIDGKVFLLVASANKEKDGKIELFEVDEYNFDEVFGNYSGMKKVILRKTK